MGEAIGTCVFFLPLLNTLTSFHKGVPPAKQMEFFFKNAALDFSSFFHYHLAFVWVGVGVCFFAKHFP